MKIQNAVRLQFFTCVAICLFSCTTTKETGNGKKNIVDTLQVSILDFGATPNDGIDDSQAIQTAIDEAIRSGGQSQVFIPPGTYDINKGIVIAKPGDSGQYSFVSLHISGQIAGFSSNPAIGASSVLRSHGNGFALAIQNGRQCVIENIVFEGAGNDLGTPTMILHAQLADWGYSDKSKTDRFSPQCAVAIDPFHQTVPPEHRYAGFEKLYTNTGTSGSSMILLHGCSFSKHYIGIANNPAIGSGNGDNIRVENCYVQSCHTFWACGQTQSRNNSISNVYALFLDTFVDNKLIGQQNGAPPNITNVNIAGFCKNVFHVETAFSGISISQSYMESIWSLGIANANSVDFNQCQVQFVLPDSTIDSPPFQLFTSGAVNFTGCSLEYFNNCNSPAPFVFRSSGVNIIGGMIEGGVVLADGISNEGGENLHRVNYDYVQLKCFQSMVNSRETGAHLSNLYGHVLLGGTMINTYEQASYQFNQPTYNLYKIENVTFHWNDNHTGSFITDKPYVYKIGDNILNDQWYDLSLAGLGGRNIRGIMGYVSKIENKKITLTGVPAYVHDGPMNVYYVGYYILLPDLIGSIQTGSNSILLDEDLANQFQIGDRIYSPFFEPGIFIQSKENAQLILSGASTATATNVNLITPVLAKVK